MAEVGRPRNGLGEKRQLVRRLRAEQIVVALLRDPPRARLLPLGERRARIRRRPVERQEVVELARQHRVAGGVDEGDQELLGDLVVVRAGGNVTLPDQGYHTFATRPPMLS
jgi:hypothetical protein